VSVDPGPEVRGATTNDLPFIKRMLYEAANRPGEQWPPFDISMAKPHILRFWDGWMRKGDVGVVAERSGTPVGAAWIRAFSGQELGRWDDAEIPVLAIGVERPFRGVGIGRQLMRALLDASVVEGVEAIDLTTGSFNEAALQLYRSFGFEVVDQDGEAVRMRLTLAMNT
jgi:ribosomal protein S18 acetylase RimI-like enzyme